MLFVFIWYLDFPRSTLNLNFLLQNDSRLDRTARCWSRMTHASGDSVSRGDCVLLRASVARAQPYVARVASLWENPDDGENRENHFNKLIFSKMNNVLNYSPGRY